MSAFSDAIAQGLAAVGDVAGELVNYQRGSDVIVGIVGVPGLDRRSVDAGEESAPVGYVANDWILRVVDLVIRGQAILPKRGDRVIRDGGQVYEVNSEGDQPWRYSDPGATRVRVHTKQMGA